MGGSYALYPASIPGWSCSELFHLVNVPAVYNLDGSYFVYIYQHVNQVVDLNTQYVYVEMIQTLSFPSKGTYLFSFAWVPPIGYPEGKGVVVTISGDLIVNISITDPDEPITVRIFETIL